MGIKQMAPMDGKAYKLPISEPQLDLSDDEGRGAARRPRPRSRCLGACAAAAAAAASARRSGRRRQSRRPPAPAPAVRPSDESSFWMLSLMASAVSCTAAFSG